MGISQAVSATDGIDGVPANAAFWADLAEAVRKTELFGPADAWASTADPDLKAVARDLLEAAKSPVLNPAEEEAR